MDHSRVPAGALPSRVNIGNCCPSSPCVSIRGDWIRRAGPHGMPNRSRSKPAEYLPGRPLSCINIQYTTFLFDLHVSDALIIWSRPLGNNAYFDSRTHTDRSFKNRMENCENGNLLDHLKMLVVRWLRSKLSVRCILRRPYIHKDCISSGK